MSELKQYIRQQEVLVIAIGLVIGFALKDFVEKFLASFITPILDELMGGSGALKGKVLDIFGVNFRPGLFIDATINFFVIVGVIYVMVRVFNGARSQINHNAKNNSKKD